MSSQNHDQPIPSPDQTPDQGEVPPSGVAMPTPPEDNPSPEPAESTPVTSGNGAEQPLPSSPGESVEERVLKLEQRQEGSVEDMEQPLPPTQGMSLEERVSKLEQWQEAMDQQFKQQQQQLEEKDNQIRRRAAEFDNFRRRSERDQDKLKLRYTCAVLREILPIVDNFERARKALSPEKLETLHALDIHQDYQGIYKQLVTALKRLNVSSMKVEGQTFDPSLHEAVMRERSHDYEEDVVMEELQRGYHLEGEVLRHAMVKVSMGPGPAE